ncbi:Na+/H+ antiporter NhaC [Nocardiopsis sediminis]|uniref:Na+/H+ antiporter NhaC n=1 Tax=Nocardiopsis sediminis TaxID=1778267 RepID=A0ABV8FQK5_9ACTN
MQTHTEPAAPGTPGADTGAGREPTFRYALSAVLMIVAILLIGSLAFQAQIQLLLFICIVALIPLVMRLGHDFERTQAMAFDSVRNVLGLIMILVAVGALISSWAAAGTIPALVRVGLLIVSPAAFLPVTLLICMLVSLATGTSWGTIGTVGVAMIGVGEGLGYPMALTAGAIVSGAYFGDKMSPFSDSTNLNAALVGVDLIAHIRHMMWTTVPAIVLAAGVFTVIGVGQAAGGAPAGEAAAITAALEENFRLGLPAFLPVAVVIVLLVLRRPAFPSIFLGALAGSAVAVVYQGESVTSVAAILYSGFTLDSGFGLVDELVSGGGIESMLGTVALFMFAVGMAGLLNHSGMILSLIRPFMRLVTTQRRLMVTSVILVPLLIALGASFSFAAVMAGTLLAPLYAKFHLDPRNLSRVLEDTGTVNDPTFPWSSGGVFIAGTLGVATLAYLPFYFFGIFSVVMSLVVAVTGWTVRRLPDAPATAPDRASTEAAPA